MRIRPQSEFPLLDRYAQAFPITEETIFAYDDTIYTNNDLPTHLIIHETTHLTQQKRDGLSYWVDQYLTNDDYRLAQEIEAYRNQVHCIKDKNQRYRVMLHCAHDLSSDLYGNIITTQEAIKCIQ